MKRKINMVFVSGREEMNKPVLIVLFDLLIDCDFNETDQNSENLYNKDSTVN